MPLSRLSVGTYLEMILHATCQGHSHLSWPQWADPSLKSGINVRKLISTFKKKKEKEKKGACGE